jgi:hypothetical protein
MEFMGNTLDDTEIIGVSVLTHKTNPATITIPTYQLGDASGTATIDQYAFWVYTKSNAVQFSSQAVLMINHASDYKSDLVLGKFQLAYVDFHKEVIRILKARKVNWPYAIEDLTLDENEIPKYVLQVEQKASNLVKEADEAIQNHSSNNREN